MPALHTRAVAAGVAEVLVVANDLESSRRAIELAERYDGWLASVGVHPHECGSWDRRTAREVRTLAAHPKVRAIGETGLDHYREFQPRDVQERAFAEQCALAVELGLPVVVHSRQSLDAVAEVLEDAPGITGVMHSYAGDARQARECTDLGLHISLSGIVTFRREHELRDAAAEIPLERMLLETDAPYLSPEPLRGRRNEPAHLPHTAAVVAAAVGMSVRSLAEKTTRNARAVFGATAASA